MTVLSQYSIDKENKKDIVILSHVELAHQTDEHISTTEDFYFTNGNYPPNTTLEPLKDINRIGHPTGKYVSNEDLHKWS